jgi:hypothetical protein
MRPGCPVRRPGRFRSHSFLNIVVFGARQISSLYLKDPDFSLCNIAGRTTDGFHAQPAGGISGPGKQSIPQPYGPLMDLESTRMMEERYGIGEEGLFWIPARPHPRAISTKMNLRITDRHRLEILKVIPVHGNNLLRPDCFFPLLLRSGDGFSRFLLRLSSERQALMIGTLPLVNRPSG